jgi:hypothetical protein
MGLAQIQFNLINIVENFPIVKSFLYFARRPAISLEALGIGERLWFLGAEAWKAKLAL